MPATLTRTDLPHPVHRGKVRDIYDLGEFLLLVATDRLSAFDVVLPDGIPEKGVVLTEMSRFWFERTAQVVPNHFVAMGYEDRVRGLVPDLPPDVARRAMLVRKARPLPVECVVRGYLAGSGWAEYRRQGTIGLAPAPAGLQESSRLEPPLFTPTTKAQAGHDEPMTLAQVESLVGAALAAQLRRLSLDLYGFAEAYARERGIIIADTKFEFGLVDGAVILIDEALTPDSSRFWSAEDYAPGRPQDSLDKQFVRDWLTASGWDKQPPGPHLPDEIVQQTATRYRDVFRRLTDRTLSDSAT